MRILIITDQFPPEHFGGMAQHAWHISHYLASRHDVQVLLPEGSDVDQDTVPFGIAPRLTMRFTRIDAMRALSVAREFKPDAIHVCTAGLAFPSLARRYPIVTRVVGNDFLRPWCGGGFLLRSLYYRMPSARFREYIQRHEMELRRQNVISQLKSCASVVANTEWTKDRLVENGLPPDLVKVVSGGCDTSIFNLLEDRAGLRQHLGFAHDEIILLVASNLVTDKALDVMLHAVARLVKSFPTLRYVVVGSGPEEQKLKTLVIDLEISKNVNFVGQKSQQDLKNFYQTADIYVQASRVESMGRTYMEAGACGIPVIASRVGGVPSVVEDGKNGLLVNDPEDVGEVVEKITTLLENPELRSSMGAEGMRLAKDEFSWESVGEVFEEQLLAFVGYRNTVYE